MVRRWSWLLVLVAAGLVPFWTTRAGQPEPAGWQAHDPISYSNLTLFPVTSPERHNSNAYITLDEGLESGEVEVTELGAALRRRRPGMPQPDRARVNTLALVNHSKKALLLLAGEVVTGGKQDRVISKDRIVPPGAEPLPLDVFCVEPGRWHGASAAFTGQSFMAAPSVRHKAAVARNQQEVWDATREVRDAVAATAGAAAELSTSSSYAGLERSARVRRTVDDASQGLQRDYEKALGGALRNKNVVGVVVAINGEVVWADLFADSQLFQRYWSKLLRSYVLEALSVPLVEHATAARAAAQRFLDEQEGKQIIEVEPGEYRLVQIDHPRYSIFELASLWEKAEPVLHFNKLRKELGRGPKPLLYRR